MKKFSIALSFLGIALCLVGVYFDMTTSYVLPLILWFGIFYRDLKDY